MTQDDRSPHGGAGKPQEPPTPPPWPPRQEVGAEPEAEPEEEKLYEPAEFPQGFWRRLDYMLHNPERILESLRRDLDLWRMSRMFFAIALAMAAIYGAVMGATNLLQGSSMATGGKFLMILTSAIKVPVLYLLTFVIVLLPVYVANTFVGPRLSFTQVLTVALASSAVMAIVLASTATVAFFFSITSRSYHFIKSLHVLFFVYAGFVGVRFFQKSIHAATPGTLRAKLGRLLLPAFVLYAFVGMELAWVLRPFVGDPDMTFQLFRPRYGSFYESVVNSVRRGVPEKLSGGAPDQAPDEAPDVEEPPAGDVQDVDDPGGRSSD